MTAPLCTCVESGNENARKMLFLVGFEMNREGGKKGREEACERNAAHFATGTPE